MTGKRFSARYDPRERMAPRIGERLIVEPEHLWEEWDRTVGGGRSLIPRRIAQPAEPRVGKVVAVRQNGEVVLDPLPDGLFEVAAILSCMQDTLLCETDALRPLLAHLAGQQVPVEQWAYLRGSAAPWLRQRCPDLANIRVPKAGTYETESEWRAWVDGVGAAIGAHRFIPAPARRFEMGPSIEEDGWEAVRQRSQHREENHG